MIGIDITKTKKFAIEKNSSFIKKTFTGYEIGYSYKHTRPEIHLAGIFSAKEAIIKCINTKIEFNDIEIRHEKNGKPIAFIKNKRFSGDISISHTDEIAVAIAV